jgi:hypothetical protein
MEEPLYAYPGHPARRSNADYRWTRPKIIAFLHALRALGAVGAAARSVGMSRQSAYRLRARLGPQFASVWDEGLMLARKARLRAEAQRWDFSRSRQGPQGYRPQGDGQGDSLGTR